MGTMLNWLAITGRCVRAVGGGVPLLLDDRVHADLVLHCRADGAARAETETQIRRVSVACTVCIGCGRAGVWCVVRGVCGLVQRAPLGKVVAEIIVAASCKGEGVCAWSEW